jgi:heptosyltransferase-3
MTMNSSTGAQAGNILVFRIGQLGDTLISLPAIHAIRERHPHHRLVLLTERQETASFVSSWEVLGPTGWFADVVFYRTARGVLRRLFTLLTLAWQLRWLRCEMVYDLTPERKLMQSCRDRFFFKRVIGIRDYHGGGYLTRPDKNAAGVLPQIEPEWKRLLRAAGAEMPATPFHLSIPEEERRKAQELLVRAGIPAGVRLLGVGPGSKMPSKVWPLERFREVGSRLLKNYPNCMLLVVGGRDDVARGKELCSAWGPRARNLAGELSPYGSAEVLRQCIAYVGNDTGAMHLAGMVGTPCVALFSARDYPGQWEPYGKGHVVLRHETECAGCMRTDCPYENKCLNLISVDEAEKAVNSVINDPLMY